MDSNEGGTNSDSCDSDDVEDFDGWSDCEIAEDLAVLCLFCDTTFKSCEILFSHCVANHHFDIAELKRQMSLDCFSYIRLVNYIRKTKPIFNLTKLDVRTLDDIINNDDYLKPVIEDDALLMFDIEGLLTVAIDEIPVANEDEEFKRNPRLEQLENRLQDTEQQLAASNELIAQMKSSALELFQSAGGNVSTSNDQCDVHCEGDNYFSGYAHFSIHHEMLRDEVRTSSYRNAILTNPTVFEDKIVLDVGCGTSILSMFAARAGATQVYGVDQSEIIYRAMDIVRENKLEDRVTLLKGRMENIHLKDKVDIIVSEWMGYFLLFESMLDTVIYSRENHLKPGGLVLPNRSTINVAGISDIDAHSKLVTFWDDVYGFKMSCLKREVVQEANVEVVTSDKLITGPCLVKDLNLTVCSTKDAEFVSSFQLKVIRQGLLTGFVGWFDVYFDLPNRITLSTSPCSTPTHWKQTVFYLLEPLPVNEDQIIEGKISCKRLTKNQRCLEVQFDFNNRRHTYLLQ